jgi:hypothetical protein
MDQKRLKILFICVVIFVGSFMFRATITSAIGAYFYARQALGNARNPKPAQAIATSPPKPPVNTATQVPFPNVVGIWRAQVALADRGICSVRLEIAPDAAGQFSGFSELLCTNLTLPSKPPNSLMAGVVDRMDPESAVLAGSVQNGSLLLKVDKNIGADSHGCALTSLTVTPFGTNQIAAQWEETGCAGGHAILQRSR